MKQQVLEEVVQDLVNILDMITRHSELDKVSEEQRLKSIKRWAEIGKQIVKRRIG